LFNWPWQSKKCFGRHAATACLKPLSQNGKKTVYEGVFDNINRAEYGLLY